ncbi:MAG: HD family hydrolase [Pyrinomonadaceae bacterium]
MISTFLELQRLKRLDRTGWTLRGLAAGSESIAAHSYGVTVAAMMLADGLRARGVAVNVERVLRMALVHDWAEARTGDLPRAAAHYYGAETRRAAERSAFGDIVESLGCEAVQYRNLHDEYEERSSLEAQVVKAADTIDLLTQALTFERAGARGLDEFWEAADATDLNLEGVLGEVVRGAVTALVEERAKHL